MKSTRHSLASIAIGVGLLLVGALSLARVAQKQMTQLPGTPMAATLPDLRVTDLAGTPMALSELRGRPLVINFWATWCPPCRDEMPALQRVGERWRARGASVIAINFEENGETIRRYLADNGLDLPVYLDNRGEAAEILNITYLPTTLFVDRQGVIRSRVEGPLSQGQMEAGLRALRR